MARCGSCRVCSNYCMLSMCMIYVSECATVVAFGMYKTDKSWLAACLALAWTVRKLADGRLLLLYLCVLQVVGSIHTSMFFVSILLHALFSSA